MPALTALLTRVRSLDVSLEAEGEGIRVNGTSRLPASLLAEVKVHKSALLAYLQSSQRLLDDAGVRVEYADTDVAAAVLLGQVLADAGVGSAEAAPDEPHTTSQEEESKEIEGDLVDREVEPLVEERVVCAAAEDQRGVFLDSNQDGTHEEHREPPEHQCVHGPGSTLGAAHRALRHHLGPNPAQSGSPVDLGLGRTAHPPEPNPAPDSPGKDAQRQERQTVKDQFGNGIDVSKNLARQLLVAGDQHEHGRKLLKDRRQGSQSVPGQFRRHRQPIRSRQIQRSAPPDHC